MTDDSKPRIFMRHELTDREVFFFGEIVVLWGMIANELFMQTLNTFSEAEIKPPAKLPRAMNNIQFTEIKELWKERVVDTADDIRKPVLLEQYNELSALGDFRDALIHSVWSFDLNDVGVLVGKRVKKRDYITVKITADELQKFAERLGVINLHIRYPRGTEDRAAALEQSGGYMSRSFIAMISKHPMRNELYGLPPDLPESES